VLSSGLSPDFRSLGRARILLNQWPRKEELRMGAVKILALALIAAGVLALAYGGFTYTKESHDAKLGPLEIQVKDKEHVNVPVWAGVAAVAGGALLLIAPIKT
jgi:hypothetical protein